MHPLNNMRKFHNMIKRKYLNKYTNIINKPVKLLDLASGKGGDINKWKSNKKIKYVEGYDIDSDSVIEARRRLEDIRRTKKKTEELNVFFYIKDLSKTELKCKEKFDIITSHFAFHYFFKSIKTLKTILKTIDNCSKKNTILILTLFDGNKLKNINSTNYRITIKNNTEPKNNYTHYNNKVEVYIKDSVLDEPTIEYIVKPEFLEKKMKDIGFYLIETKSFKELYYENRSLNIDLTNEEKKLSFMNRIYILKKKN